MRIGANWPSRTAFETFPVYLFVDLLVPRLWSLFSFWCVWWVTLEVFRVLLLWLWSSFSSSSLEYTRWFASSFLSLGTGCSNLNWSLS